MNILTIGDIVKIVRRDGGVLVHQVNCQRVAGAGLALQIRQQWPLWYAFFRATDPQLGNCTVWSNNMGSVNIASIYGQYNYGRRGRYTDYDAVESGLAKLAKMDFEGQTIYLPMFMGCGLAGGDFAIVYPLITKHLPDATLVKDGRNP